jgi:anti-sigma-K factor RskA
VTGCETRGELVGGYVLGALEPAELDDMRRHLAECPSCGAEVDELADLPQLLDLVEPEAVPPPALRPSVEEAVLDRFTRERRHERRARRPLLSGRRIAALAAACVAALALTLALTLPGGEEDRQAYARAELTPVSGGASAWAMAYAAEVDAGTRVTLRARGLPIRQGRVYELWCVRNDGRWVSGGTFRADRNGRAQAVLTAGVRPGDYHVMVVSRRAEEGRGAPLMRGELEY